MHFKVKWVYFILSIVLIFAGCGSKSDLKIDYEKYTLTNGLEVILHEDKSDPITAVAEFLLSQRLDKRI